MTMLVNIDNGGTLTDICVSEGERVWRTKTLTTPHDLSLCLIEGLAKASAAVFGEADVERLLLATEHIRYSTTQGTNALVQRKGPRLGLVHGPDIVIDGLRASNPDLFDALVGDRTAALDPIGDAQRYDAVRAVSGLVAIGANRIVVLFGGADRDSDEKALKRALLRAFPAHLLGAVPLLYSHEISNDDDDRRRGWTALFNAFLHPAMERFLYSAEHRLREARAQRPLLIFRNDGQSARVAKTIAIKTYSSGPRGGADGAEVLARHYRIDHLVSLDIGGTTTDISAVEHGRVPQHGRGTIEGVPISLPLTAVTSVGVGGSSIVRVDGGAIRVGPESVGSAPGPACFGLGGTDATITDALFTSGLLDPACYFGGAMAIDIARARKAVANAVGVPLGLSEDQATAAIEEAWVASVADGVTTSIAVQPGNVLAAFGGAGPQLICKIADRLGIATVLIPRMAAVFSAYGIGFSDIGHSHEAPLSSLDTVAALKAELSARAKRGMVAEGIDPAECAETAAIITTQDGAETDHDVDGAGVPVGAAMTLRLTITRKLPHPDLSGSFAPPITSAASASGERMVLINGVLRAVPLFDAAKLGDGTGAAGPAVLEEEFYTCRIDAGWQFVANSAGDLFITRSGA